MDLSISSTAAPKEKSQQILAGLGDWGGGKGRGEFATPIIPTNGSCSPSTLALTSGLTGCRK